MDAELLRAELSDAILTHATWKSRLRTAAITRAPAFDHPDAGRDDCCRFGRLLLNLPALIRDEAVADKAQHAHTEFHKMIGGIGQLIDAGDHMAALALVNDDPFTLTSARLVAALDNWRRALGGQTDQD